VLDDRQIDLVQEGIDVALRMGKLLDSALTVRRIARCKRLVLGTPAYFDRAGTPQTPAELSKHQAVVYLQGEGSIWSFRRDSSEAAVTVHSRLRVTAEGVRAAVLAQVGLTPRLAHYPKQLSGGEQQRVAIARAFVTHPDVLFADEPTGNLDTSTGQRITDLLFDLNRRTGSTLVLVTHDRTLAGRCGRVLELDAGHTVN